MMRARRELDRRVWLGLGALLGAGVGFAVAQPVRGVAFGMVAGAAITAMRRARA